MVLGIMERERERDSGVIRMREWIKEVDEKVGA